ncbi:hypothetical protein BHE74_00016780 [Ensete ventricosum]|nr:hypothetical protein BHE74_00016780 [Ensete ventricosum]
MKTSLILMAMSAWLRRSRRFCWSQVQSDQTIMPSQDQAPMKDVDLKSMSRCIVNHGEGLMTVDFSDDLSLAEKLVQHKTSTVELVKQKLSSDSESEYEGIELRV